MTIGQSIKATRKSKGVTQTKLAEKVGVRQCVFSWWETDRATPSIIFLICIADVLDVTLDELVGRNVQEKQKNF